MWEVGESTMRETVIGANELGANELGKTKAVQL